MMRILHLISSSGLYGAERVVIELSKGLKKTGCGRPIVGVIKNKHNPHIEIADEAKECDIDTVTFPCNGQFDLKLIPAIRGFIESHMVDIVHCHGYKSNIYGLLASKKIKTPTVTTNHNWLTSHWKLKLYCLLDSFWIRYFDKIVAVSEDVKKDMVRYKVPGVRICIIDNGVDLDRFEREVSTEKIRKEFKPNGNSILIGTIGNLSREKGHEYLFKAAKKILEIDNRMKFLIVGDGVLRKELEMIAVSLGIRDNIIFAGYRKDIPELLSIMDIFVLPSIEEGLPMVLLEAMAARKPVIATRVGAIPKVIAHNKSGVLIEPGNVFELTSAILTLTKEKTKAEEMGQMSHNMVNANYSSEVMTSKYITLYNELIKNDEYSSLNVPRNN